MRRMYSEQELTNIIKEVFDAEIEAGAFDEKVSDAVDAYLVEHPVDVTALEGQDVELNSLDADGLITGAEIIEKMSGYSAELSTFKENFTAENIYSSVVKNGNKLTFVTFLKIKRTGDIATYGHYSEAIKFNVPADIGAKLYPSDMTSSYGYILATLKVLAIENEANTKELICDLSKNTGTQFEVLLIGLDALSVNTDYYVRIEQTFLLSDNLINE